MDERIRSLWRRTRLDVWPERYVLASLPPRHLAAAAALVARAGGSFAALHLERHEVSVTVTDELWRDGPPVAHAAVGGPYRVVTLDADLDLDVVGYLAPAALLLAASGVPIVPQCSYRTDHILIAEADLAPAMRALGGLTGASS